MIKCLNMLRIIMILLVTTNAIAQDKIESIIGAEYDAGHFNGALLVVKDGKVVSQVNKGTANFQFAVPITNDTRFPIASTTKLFTAVLTLQLYEKKLLKLEDKASTYIVDLPPNCRDVTIIELLTHYSGLKNEPIQAYKSPYSTRDYIKNYVVKDESKKAASFNYNNVDYILLTLILEVISKKSFSSLIQDNIFAPLNMANSGIIKESKIIPNLAYGYHNYTFGSGTRKDTLKNDSRYLSNYAGAGAVYSTVTDMYKMVQALKSNTLLSAKTTSSFLLKPQQAEYFDVARGYPTVGFFYNNKTFSKPVLERRGSIDGFNSVLLANKDFSNVVIILTNTDTSDLEKITDKIYSEID